MEELSRALDFTYKIVNPPDSAWGMINETGQWTGLTGMASRGDADVPGIEVIGVISDILPNFARFQACGIFKLQIDQSRASAREKGLGSLERTTAGFLWNLMIWHMPGPICMKLSGVVRGWWESDLGQV